MNDKKATEQLAEILASKYISEEFKALLTEHTQMPVGYEQKSKEFEELYEQTKQRIEQLGKDLNTLGKEMDKCSKEFNQRANSTKTENNKMKLLVTKINDVQKVIELASQFYCKIEVLDTDIIIAKNSQLTDDEFSVLAGKLVITGAIVELLNSNAVLDAALQAVAFAADELAAAKPAAAERATAEQRYVDARAQIRQILQQAL